MVHFSGPDPIRPDRFPTRLDQLMLRQKLNFENTVAYYHTPYIVKLSASITDKSWQNYTP